MSLSPTAPWLVAMRRQNREIAIAVEITLSPTTEAKFVSSHNAMLTLGSEYIPSLDTVSPIGPDIDPHKREAPRGTERNFVFVDDGQIRFLAVNGTLKGRQILSHLGEASLAIGDYLDHWGGVIEEAEPEDRTVNVQALSALRILELRSIERPGGWYRHHPYEIMTNIIDLAGVPSSLVDANSFDPDHADNADQGHWNISRGQHGISDRRITSPTNAMALLNELTRLCGVTIVEGPNGVLRLVRYDATVAAVATWGDDEIDDDSWQQHGVYGQLINRSTLAYAMKEDANGADDKDELFTRRTLIDKFATKFGKTSGEFEFTITRNDVTSQQKFTHTGAATPARVFGRRLNTAWLGSVSYLDDTITDVSPGVGDDLILVGGHTAGFVGNRKNSGSGGNWELTDDRIGVIQIGDELITVDRLTQDLDARILHEKMTSGEIPYQGAINATMRLTYRVLARGAFGTTAAAHTVGDRAGDATIPVLRPNDDIDRWADGAQIVEFTTDIAEFPTEVTDLVAINYDRYYEEGIDGATNLKFEALGKADDPLGDQPIIAWRLIRSRIPGSPTKTSEVEAIDKGLFDGLQQWWGDDGKTLGKHIFDGFEIADAGGLDIDISAGTFVGVRAPGDFSEGVTLTLLATKDSFIYYDTEAHAFIQEAVTIGAARPSEAPPWIRLGTVETGGAAIASTLDQRLTLGTMGRRMRGFPGPTLAALPDPTIADPGQTFQLVANQGFGQIYRRWQKTVDDLIIDLAPTSYWKLDETAGLTGVDAMGNHDLTHQANVNVNQGGLFNDDGKSIELPALATAYSQTAAGLPYPTVSNFSFQTMVDTPPNANLQTVFAALDGGAATEAQLYFAAGVNGALTYVINGNTTVSTKLFKEDILGKGPALLTFTWRSSDGRVEVIFDGTILENWFGKDTGNTMDIDRIRLGNVAANTNLVGKLDATAWWDNRVIEATEAQSILWLMSQTHANWENLTRETKIAGRFYMAADQAIVGAAWTPVNLDRVDGRTLGGGFNYQVRGWTVPTDGWYVLFFNARFILVSQNKQQGVKILSNGNDLIGPVLNTNGVVTADAVGCSGVAFLTAGDILIPQVSSSDANYTIDSSAGGNPSEKTAFSFARIA